MSEHFVRRSYSQFGEDCLLSSFLPEPAGFYVDVGAHHPWRYSNTALLAERGWRGINIDADPRAIAHFAEARPGDINLNIGVGVTAGVMPFAMFADGAINTFDQELAKRYESQFGPASIVDVPVRPLAAILEENLPKGVAVDYLNIDCEGLDEQVVLSNDWTRYRPRLLTIELDNPDVSHLGSHRVLGFLQQQRYVLRAQYWITTILQAVEAL